MGTGSKSCTGCSVTQCKTQYQEPLRLWPRATEIVSIFFLAGKAASGGKGNMPWFVIKAVCSEFIGNMLKITTPTLNIKIRFFPLVFGT